MVLGEDAVVFPHNGCGGSSLELDRCGTGVDGHGKIDVALRVGSVDFRGDGEGGSHRGVDRPMQLPTLAGPMGPRRSLSGYVKF